MDKEKAAQLLHDVHSVLGDLNIKHFLIDGTLLGAIREGDFIAHDTDIDLGVYTEEWDEDMIDEVIKNLRHCDIELHHTFGELDKYFEMAFKRDGIKIDLFFYRKIGGARIFHAFKNGGRNLPDDVITYAYPAELIEELAPINFQNEIYPAPENAEAVLVCKYGDDWMIPRVEWDWKYGPKNVIK